MDKLEKERILTISKAIEEKKRELDQLERELKKCKNPYVNSKSIEMEESYYYYDEYRDLDINEYTSDYRDDLLINNYNAFTDAEYARNIAKKELLLRKLDKFAWDNDSYISLEDWKNEDIEKYFIYFNYPCKSLLITGCCTSREVGQIYFKSKDVALKAVEEFEDELLEYFSR